MKGKLKTVLMIVGAAGAAGLLLFCSGAVGGGIRQGLTVCATVLIPSLFPFLILSSLVSVTRLSPLLERPLGGVVRFLYGCPGELAPAVLMSWVGGYPAGARVLADLEARGRLAPEEAARALTFCVNSGPAFLVTVVGVGVFGSPGWGFYLLGCQLAAGAITGRILCRGRPVQVAAGPPRRESMGMGPGFVHAVTAATAGMVSICGFVVAFSALGAGLEALGTTAAWSEVLWRLSGGTLTREGAACLLGGLLEIGGGCAQAQGLAPGQAALVLPFLLSFSSLSVICQVGACFGDGGVGMGLFFRSRLLHGSLTALLATPVLFGRFRTASVMMTGRPILSASDSTILGTVCLLMMCAMLAASISSPRAPTRREPGGWKLLGNGKRK